MECTEGKIDNGQIGTFNLLYVTFDTFTKYILPMSKSKFCLYLSQFRYPLKVPGQRLSARGHPLPQVIEERGGSQNPKWERNI